MNILVLESDLRDMAIIQQALSGKAHTVIPAATSAQAWMAIQAGGIQFLIINSDTTDAGSEKLVRRLRVAYPGEMIYMLLITSGASDEEDDADDLLYRPYTDADLKNRIAVAERIILLTEKLASIQHQLEGQAAFDRLTGFMNRAGFLRQAAGELERSRRASLSLSLVALDIDNFKTINERFGERVGDDVLEVVAESIRDKSRPYDCIGRWAGDEFLLALPGVIGADAEKVAARIIAGVQGTRIEVPNEAPLNVNVSAGIASILRISTNSEIESIILSAREAVARAREEGGNQVFLSYL